MKKIVMVALIAVISTLMLSGCCNTKKNARQLVDDVHYAALDGEDVLYFE